MNMCSVRHRPMPSAPKLRARRASPGASAFARTPMRRISSAQPSTVSKCSRDLRRDERHVLGRDRAGAAVDRDQVAAAQHRPVRPRPSPPSRSICSSEAPATHGRPMPRATSAACEALPPSEVRMPRAAWKPATSSASVNGPHEDHGLAVAAALRPPRRR